MTIIATRNWAAMPALERDEVLADICASLEGCTAHEIAMWAVENFGTDLVVAASMQETVLLHVFSQVMPGVEAVFLDTGYHFPETLATRDEVRRTLPVTVLNLTPRRSVAEQDEEYGQRLYERDPNLCCFLRKVVPLADQLATRAAWVTGLRRDEVPTRATAPIVSWDTKNDLVKINPLVDWTEADVQAYRTEHGLIRNPLMDRGYPSIGCGPCTRAVRPGEGSRAGRWAGTAKTECGIHE